MIGQLISAGGSALGGLAASNIMGGGLREANRLSGQGVDYLKGLNTQQRADFQPYMQAGQQGLGQYQNLLGQGNQAAMPAASKPFEFDMWKDPSAQYGIDQSNAAINASALASGSVGGGLARAITGNTQSLAQKAYQNAFDRYIKQNEQDFGQGQQLYQNQTQNYLTQLGGYQNLMGQGLNAAGTTGGLSSSFGSGVNQNYMNMAANTMQNARDRADAFSGGLSGAVSGISSLF